MSSLFGWSMPPGCSLLPDDIEGGPTELEEEILGVLENSRLAQADQDSIMKLVEEAEKRVRQKDCEAGL